MGSAVFDIRYIPVRIGVSVFFDIYRFAFGKFREELLYPMNGGVSLLRSLFFLLLHSEGG